MRKKALTDKIKSFVMLHVVLFLYSIVSLLSKRASLYEFMSSKFVFLYSAMLLCLVIYALLWQQVLRYMPLTVAFANKSVVIIWGIIWGKIFFLEQISWKMIVGAIIIIIGIVMVVTDDK